MDRPNGREYIIIRLSDGKVSLSLPGRPPFFECPSVLTKTLRAYGEEPVTHFGFDALNVPKTGEFFLKVTFDSIHSCVQEISYTGELRPYGFNSFVAEALVTEIKKLRAVDLLLRERERTFVIVSPYGYDEESSRFEFIYDTRLIHQVQSQGVLVLSEDEMVSQSLRMSEGIVINLKREYFYVTKFPEMNHVYHSQIAKGSKIGLEDSLNYFIKALCLKGFDLTAPIFRDELREIFFNNCYCSVDYEADCARIEENNGVEKIVVIGDTEVPLGAELFQSIEVLFRPSMIGFENSSSIMAKVEDMIQAENIVMLNAALIEEEDFIVPGISERIRLEIENLSSAETLLSFNSIQCESDISAGAENFSEIFLYDLSVRGEIFFI